MLLFLFPFVFLNQHKSFRDDIRTAYQPKRARNAGIFSLWEMRLTRLDGYTTKKMGFCVWFLEFRNEIYELGIALLDFPSNFSLIQFLSLFLFTWYSETLIWGFCRWKFLKTWGFFVGMIDFRLDQKLGFTLLDFSFISLSFFLFTKINISIL